MSDSIPEDVPKAYRTWARQYYDLDERAKKPLKEGEGGKPSLRQLILRLEGGLPGHNLQRGRK